MSVTNIRFPGADILAAELELYLRQGSERLERAGSLRRRLPVVGDIEFVLTPATAPALFAEIQTESALDQQLGLLKAGGLLRKHPTKPADGEKLKRFLLPYSWEDGKRPVLTSQGDKWTTLELFIAPRHSFGYVHAIRTGPQEASKKLVTQRNKGGWLPDDCVCKDGRVWQVFNNAENPEPIYLPDEADFFELCGLAHAAPEERTPDRWQLSGGTYR